MSIPAELNDEFLKYTQHRDIADVEECAKGLWTLMNAYHGVGTLETFYFADCAYDQDSSTLYARLKPRKNASIEDDVYLTRIDMSDMQIAINMYKNVEVLPPFRDFFTRMGQELSAAEKQMNIHDKTVAWVNVRDEALAAPAKILAMR